MISRIEKAKKMKYMNEFPIIIIIAIAVIVIILTMMYLNIKPYGTINRDGYLILSNDMTYNLISSNFIEENDTKFDIGVASVTIGDYIYKQMDTYYVGIEKKQKVDYDYPLYSPDGLTIYNQKEDVILIDRNFEKVKGYPGLSLNYGVLYNDGDIEPADDLDYLFLYLNNTIYINAQTMVIKTLSNEYTIPMHSPIYFDTNYINYYVFDGKEFKYNIITDIYYDSLIKIGDVTLSYNDFMIQMGLIEFEVEKEETSKEDPKEDEIEDPKEDEIEKIEYIKPTVSVLDFSSNVYSINSELVVNDPSAVIVINPTFELYTSDEKLYLRKKFSTGGKIKISGLSSNAQYKIVGTYSYKNEFDVIISSTFYEGVITTKDINALEEIKVVSELGELYPNKIEIKNVNITNANTEAVLGIKKAVLEITKENTTETKSVNLTYSQIRNLINGEKTTITSSNNLESNTVYKYKFNFYDKDGNKLKASGDIEGTIKTSKAIPTVKISSDVDRKNNIAKINVETKNKDNVYIKDFEYQLYSYTGYLIEDGMLNYEDGSTTDLVFDNLDYNTNYILRITGIYDLEDGKGEQEILIENDFTTSTLKDFTAWYNEDTLEVMKDSINAEIGINKTTTALEMPMTEIFVYLVDKDGNDIIDENGDLRFYKKYTKEEYDVDGYSYYYMNPIFEGLKSDTEYNIKIKINVQQLENNISLEKELTPSIKTPQSDAYINVKSKKLFGDNLDITLEIVDHDNLVSKDGVIIEIYNRELSSREELAKNEKYIYRSQYKSADKTTVSLNLHGYNENNYTIFVSSNPYGGQDVAKYLSVKESEDVFSKAINLNRDISARLEMHDQQQNTDKTLITKIGLSYDLYENVSNVYLVDCVGDSCTNLGYMDSNKNINEDSRHERFIGNEIIADEKGEEVKKIVSILNEMKDQKHMFYLLVEKSNVNLSNFKRIDKSYIDDNAYILSSLEYNTGYSIYNIDDASDFFDKTLIKRNNETRHYVVTNNINFDDGIINFENVISGTNNNIKNFKGEIDFQGYKVNLHENNTSNVRFFESIASTGVLKNAVLNYNLSYAGVVKDVYGFIYTNSGTISNFIVNVEQIDLTGRVNNFGALSYNNNGIIDNFVVYLNSDIHTYSNSSLVTYGNRGTTKNGYVTSNPNDIISYKIKLYDSNSSHGTFAQLNYGTIQDVYNLIDVEYNGSSYGGDGISTIVKSNYGTVKNTISVATTTQIAGTSAMKGQNIANNTSIAKNNYYVDTNRNNVSYSGNYNKKINIATLKNKNSWEVIINQNNSYTIIDNYYPILKMNKFIDDYQTLIPITGGKIGESELDVMSSEALHNNISETGKGKLKVFVSNPYKYEITQINIEDLTSTINETETYYDENSQSTVVILDLELEENDIAKSLYYIVSIDYLDDFSEKHTIQYNDNDFRTVEIEMYRRLSNYEELITSIDKNENIYLLNNLEVLKNEILLPISDKTYSAIFEGNQKTINLKNKQISRGYFFYSVTGTIKNVQITNMNLTFKSGAYAGFIRQTNNAKINNIDVSDSKIEIKSNTGGNRNIYIGGIISYASSTIIESVSTNNLEIRRSDNWNSKIYAVDVGGIVGYTYYSHINNSYSYNLNVNNLKSDTYSYTSNLGGIAGRSYHGNITNCYTTGLMNTGYYNVGGIVGLLCNAKINNNYSYIKINSIGNYIGGIVGNLKMSESSPKIENNMFIGKIINKYSVELSSVISPVLVKDRIGTNYAQIEDDYLSSIGSTDLNIINNLNNLIDFDKNNSFIEDKTIADLPYLKTTSFVEQQVKRQKFVNLNEDIKYTIEYKKNSEADLTCSINNNIINVYTGEPINDYSLYENACADYAVLTFQNTDFTSDKYTLEVDGLIVEPEGDGYKLTPELYTSSYEATLKSNNTEETSYVLLLNVTFYKKIAEENDWNSLPETEYSNIILTNDLELPTSAENNKLINNLLGNGYKISMEESINSNLTSKKNLIYEIKGTMRDITFDSIKIISNDGSRGIGIIRNHNGIIENCSFKNITIESNENSVAIIPYANGIISDTTLNNITVKGKVYVAGLAAVNESDSQGKNNIKNVKADTLTISGKQDVAGIASYISYFMKNISVENVNIISSASGGAYIGGIVSRGICEDCHLEDGKIMALGSDYVGGIGGYALSQSSSQTINSSISNIAIYTTGETLVEGIGGIYGGADYLHGCEVDNLTIAKNSDDENNTKYELINADFVGGLVGTRAFKVINSTVKNSNISGKNHVGGLIGDTTSTAYEISGNIVINTEIKSNGDNVGGLIGNYDEVSAGNPRIFENIVAKTSITGNSKVGGIIGYLRNSTTFSQNIEFKRNLVVGVSINSNDNPGGIIGNLYQLPSSSNIKFDSSLYYNPIESSENLESHPSSIPLVGKIENNGTGVSTGYGEGEISEEEFANKSGFKEYIDIRKTTKDKDYQITSSDYLDEFSYNPFVLPYGYFPTFSKFNGDEYYYVPIPYDENTGTSSNLFMSTFSRSMFRNYSNSYNNPIDIDYDVYTSGINKINIEFSEINSDVHFYYEIGDYVSNMIPINNRTYTITYDFKAPIKLYVSNGFNYKDSVINPNELSKTLSLINGETYYLNNGMLYSESKAITGQFNNLYGTEALTSDGKIYNIISKQEYDSYVDYNILNEEIPLYETLYKENKIKTYYNYSTVNDVEKELQLFVKNGNLNSISNTLSNRKDMYIIDYYNNNEIQIVLKDDGKLYSIKHNINYPADIVNNEIVELYTNINSSDSIVSLKYKNGAVYTFDYRTGKMIFNNVSKEHLSFLDYVKSKIGNSSKYNVIENISANDKNEKYKEIEILKNKISDISVDEAKDKIYSTNQSIKTNDNYITVYNEITQNYDIYKISSILNDSMELESETNKIYSNYELVKFYKTFGKGKNKKSLSGIVIFSISILLVLSALILLIRHRRIKKGAVV